MTSALFLAVGTIKGGGLRAPVAVKGVTIMEALVKLHEKCGSEIKVERTEIKRVDFLVGGFRVVSNVSPRTVRKYAEDKGSFLSRLNIKVN